MIEENIYKLRREFNRIRKMGYVKTIRDGYGGIGFTFEYLLVKEEDSLEIPDFYGIEIKTKRAYSKSYISLFNAVPTGSCIHETKRLRDCYGYPYKNDKNLKKLNTEIFASCVTRVGLWYYFQLYVDWERQKLILFVYDYKKKLIDDSTYWDFDILKEKLERKLQVLALVKAWTNNIGGKEYFKYYKMNIYLFRDFNSFLLAIEEGYVSVKLSIGSYCDSKKYGMVKEHGVSFSISEENILNVFDIFC